jgi:hypothetical protein
MYNRAVLSVVLWYIHCIFDLRVNGMTLSAPATLALNGKHIAVAFHGAYHRHSGPGNREEWSHQEDLAMRIPPGGCTDYFQHADHIERAIIAPLKGAGNNVSVYFHTYNSSGGPELDEQLVARLGPRRHTFSKTVLPKIVDSYIEVLDLVGNDDDIDYIVLLRFDVRYKRRISELNVQWDKTNFAFRDRFLGFTDPQSKMDHKVADLFHVLPMPHRLPMIHALHVSRGVDPHGSGHWAWEPLAEQLGSYNLNLMSNNYNYTGDYWRVTYTGDLLPNEDFEPPFLGLSRACGAGPR